METIKLKVGGFGGQGVILAGHVIGKAAAIYGGKHATMTQSFGPEARGSACSAQVLISDDVVRYPYIRRPNVLMVMSQDAYREYEPSLEDGGMLLIEDELVKPENLRPGIRVYGAPATRIAEELGKKMVLNIVMIGFFAAVTNLLEKEALRKAVASSVPKGTEELNLTAFERGYACGADLVAKEASRGRS